ncbi:MAG TPA: zinc-binding dehydrogenase [Ktedonobacterales bacterium]
MTEIPKTMRALVLHAYDLNAYDSLTVEERPTPKPGPGEALIRMSASPINPSDLATLQGVYGKPKPLPIVPGIEGSGTVVATGTGFLARRLLGKRVACAAGAGDGTWAEYVVAPALQCAPLPDSINDEQGAMRIVNPYTAWAHVGIARQTARSVMVQTAAASALGQMVNKLAKLRGVKVINVVRRESQADALRKLGAEHIFVSDSPSFDAQLRDLCRQLGAQLAFDSVGGEMTGRLLAALPARGRVIHFGSLAETLTTFHPSSMIFDERRIEGFYLSHWIARQNPLALLSMQRQLFQLGDLTYVTIQGRFPLEDGQKAIATYRANMSAGKVLLMPGMTNRV